MTAAAIPEERALRDPRGACIADERQEFDNTQFAQTVTAAAAVFAAAGLGAGDVLAIMLPNRVELVTSMFAAWRLGAAAMLIVADDASAQKLGSGRGIIPVEDVTSPARPETPVPMGSVPDTLALLIYTSGTTGRPKGVMLDQANISETADRIVAWFEMTGDTRCLLVLPLFHVNGIMATIVSPLLAGEVVMRGPNVMRGHLNRPDESAQTLRGGWLWARSPSRCCVNAFGADPSRGTRRSRAATSAQAQHASRGVR